MGDRGKHDRRPSDFASAGRAEVECPGGLDEHGSWFWSVVVTDLMRIGVAKSIDAPALRVMTMWWSRLQRLSADPDSSIVELQKATQMYDGFAKRFGLTPGDRKAAGQLSVPGSRDQEDEDSLLALLEEDGPA